MQVKSPVVNVVYALLNHCNVW